MQSSGKSSERINHHFSIAIHSLSEIVRLYHFDGKSYEAHCILRLATQLVEITEVKPLDRLKLLLQQGKVLVVDYFLCNTNAELLYSTIQRAREIAESLADERGMADVLSLLGQANYWVTLNSRTEADCLGRDYDESLVCHQKALELREALGDTKGISESHFFLGTVYERLQNHDQALEHYVNALQIAEQHNHLYEKAEPTRHLAVFALMNDNLDDALTHALRALEIREAVNFKPFLPLDHLLVSEIFLKLSELDNAMVHTQKAMGLAKEMDYQRMVASSLLSSGDIQLAQNEEALARDCYEEALEIAKVLNLPFAIGRAVERLSRLTEQRDHKQ